MKIQYIDEYGETLYTSELGTVAIPRGGEHVSFQGDDYRVKSVSWMLEDDTVVVELTQNLVKKQEKDDSEGRLREAKNAIVRLEKRVDTQEKKGRLLNEQLVSVRSYLRTQKGPK